ncbi:flavin reductase family protein [Mesonia aquimarina]|uniref:flavin reductase family protein n=1 Tax=Mesonia aquimarina TaxID=1504967 RepID=UPI000EF5AE9D|nr:flavin reductase family protein [Mesonia aquimarina]
MYSIDPKEIPTQKLYGLMVSSIGPRPIAFASTINKKGEPNLSPFSFFNMFSAKPPILVFSPVRRIRDNSEKHTLQNVQATKEVVINIVNYDIVQQMSLSSTEYGDGVNEFDKAGLTMEKSELIEPFRVKESPVQFECKVNQIVGLGEEGGAGSLVVCEVIKMHINEAVLDENQKIDQEKLDQVARMGGGWYSRANMGMFEVPKPISTMGMGIDNIPLNIKESTVLTGNDLGKLGNVEELPLTEEVKTYITNNKLQDFIKESSADKIHAIAQEYLKKDDVDSAWKLLLAKK